MRRVLARLFVLFAALVIVFPCRAWAQAAPQMQVQVDADTVGVGDIVHVQLVVQSGDARPSDPSLGSTPGFAVRNASSMPSETHISINGNRMDRFGLTADFALQARQVGTFSIGPPSVVVGATRFRARSVTLKVVPAGQAPPRQQANPMQLPFTFSPFDPWKGLIPGVEPDDRPAPQTTLTTDPKLALDAPRGASYFLHATVDKTSAVVGEQVTFSVYEYIDTGAIGIELDEQGGAEATAADFVKHPLLREDQEAISVGYASIGGRTWAVKLVRRWALFPLREGDLAIGPMNIGLVRPRQAAGKRTTETLHVEVGDPPSAGRPPGYTLGDVGRFALSADVTPRDADQGGAIGVHAEISGTGNVPASIAAPSRDGVEWLVPEVHDATGPQEHDRFGGRRAFDYVVRLRRAGSVDLGELRLPYWDPDAKRYDVARAPLGVVHVKPSAQAAEEPQREVLSGLPPARAALEGLQPARAHADDSRAFWLLGVAGWPAVFGAAFLGRLVGRRALRAWQERRTSPEAELKQRVAVAQAASRGKNARDTDAATVRALHAATVAHAGVNVRGAARSEEVVARLSSAGVTEDAAAGIAELLVECEAARFAPDAADVAEAAHRWARAQKAIAALETRERRVR
jgi:hypothetical protein